MATQIVLGTGTNKVQAHEKQYFVETPDSLVLQGLDSRGEKSKTYGHLNKAATCRKCLEAGRYKYTSVRHKKVFRDTPQPFVTLERELQNTMVDTLKKRLQRLLNSVEVQHCVSNHRNTCAPTNPVAPVCSRTKVFKKTAHMESDDFLKDSMYPSRGRNLGIAVSGSY